MSSPAKVLRMLTRLHFTAEVEEWGWEIGNHSYGRPRVLDPQYAKLFIGRFCSIGPEVTIVLGYHRTDLVTTYPFKTLSQFWPTAENGEDDHETRGDVIIGNDVWIGAGSTILSGVEVGSGAVIGAGSIVTRSVPPYAIISGNPARVKRYRFDEKTIEKLLKVAWWNWDEALLHERLQLLLSRDIDAFLETAALI